MIIPPKCGAPLCGHWYSSVVCTYHFAPIYINGNENSTVSHSMKIDLRLCFVRLQIRTICQNLTVALPETVDT